jgi:hypothetical protein
LVTTGPTGERSRQVGQCPDTPRPNPARLALPVVPKGQRSGAVVQEPDRGCQRGTQNEDDRRPCPQAAHRALAYGYHRRSPARRRAAASGLTSLTVKEPKHTISAPGRHLSCPAGRSRSEVVVTRARTWSLNRSLEWARRLGASLPKRMTASWSGSCAGPTEYKVAARSSRAMAGSPRIVGRPPRARAPSRGVQRTPPTGWQYVT